MGWQACGDEACQRPYPDQPNDWCIGLTEPLVAFIGIKRGRTFSWVQNKGTVARFRAAFREERNLENCHDCLAVLSV